MVYQLQVWLLKDSHKHMEQVTIKMEPINWWQMMKEGFPEWFKRRWPVKLRERVYLVETQIRVCPHADIAWDDSKHINFLTYEDTK